MVAQRSPRKENGHPLHFGIECRRLATLQNPGARQRKDAMANGGAGYILNQRRFQIRLHPRGMTARKMERIIVIRPHL